jgi:hypothetical protein
MKHFQTIMSLIAYFDIKKKKFNVKYLLLNDKSEHRLKGYCSLNYLC